MLCAVFSHDVRWLAFVFEVRDRSAQCQTSRLFPRRLLARGLSAAFSDARRGGAHGALLIGSGAAALGWRRIKDTPALKDCPEAQELCQSGQLLALEDARLDGALEFVATRLNEVGIDPLIAKGWAVAHFYSSRYLRAYGDFDLCAPPGRYELAHATLTRLTPPSFSAAEAGDILVDCGPDLGQCTVDLHKNFGAAAHMPPIETLHARSTPAKAGSADIRLLAFEDHLRFVVTHLLVHGAWRPSGLCDVAAMVEAIPPDFDWALCLGTTKWSPDGSARRSWSRIGFWDAGSIQCRRPCGSTLPHGSSARCCANGSVLCRAIPEHCGERARQTSWSVPSLAASPLVESRRDFDRGALAAEQPSPSG